MHSLFFLPPLAFFLMSALFMAMMNGVMNMAVAASPVLGNYITFYFHWQGNVITLLGLALITLLMTMIFIPAQSPSSPKEDSTLFYILLISLVSRAGFEPPTCPLEGRKF